MDERRAPEARGRLSRRLADRVDDVRRDLRVADGAYLYGRLHGRRRRLSAFLQLYLAVHVLDVDAGDGQQLPATILRLGSGGLGLVFVDRILVHPADRDLREYEGLPGEPGR